MRVVVGADHAGFRLKAVLVEAMQRAGHEVVDVGVNSADSVDYPDLAVAACEVLLRGDADCGVLVCGTGVGMSITANKVPGIRAGVVSDTFSARAIRQHNDANVLCMGERVVGAGLAVELLDAFLGATFEGGRHQRRVDKMTALEGTRSR